MEYLYLTAEPQYCSDNTQASGCSQERRDQHRLTGGCIFLQFGAYQFLLSFRAPVSFLVVRRFPIWNQARGRVLDCVARVFSFGLPHHMEAPRIIRASGHPHRHIFDPP